MTPNCRIFERLYPEERFQLLLMAAMEVAKRVGYQSVTLEGIAAEAGVTHGLVTHYLGRIGDIKDLLVPLAVDLVVIEVIAQGLAARHTAVEDMSPEIKAQAVAYMTA